MVVTFKKGFLFSLTSFLFLFLFGLIMFSVYDLSLDASVESIKPQSITYQSYYDSIKFVQVPLMIELAGRESLQTLVNYSINTSMYVPEDLFLQIFSDLLINGTSTVTYPDFSLHTINSSRSLQYAITNISEILLLAYEEVILFQSADLEIIPLYDFLKVNQSSPFYVDIFIPFKLMLTHPEFTFFDTYIQYSIQVPITGLNDPLFGVESQGQLYRPIKNTTAIVNQWDLATLELFIDEGLYLQRPSGSSFLMRLLNTTSKITHPSSFIQSFINPRFLNDSSSYLYSFNATSDKRSFVDSFFFQNSFVNCHIGISQQEYLYSILTIEERFEGRFKLDFNSTIFFLGNDFSPLEYNVSCSPFGIT